MVSANVNLATERATVEYVPTQVTLAELKKAIIDAGYEVREMAGGDEERGRWTRSASAREAEIREPAQPADLQRRASPSRSSS